MAIQEEKTMKMNSVYPAPANLQAMAKTYVDHNLFLCLDEYVLL